MTNEVWIETPITKDGSFDFLHFNEWLHASTLETLHLAVAECERKELKHVRCCYRVSEQENLEQHKFKIRFYVKLAQEIKREIAHRRYPGLRPVSEN